MHQSGVMIEYILIKEVNDRPEHAHELGRLLGPRSDFVLLNLIPYNPTSVAEDYEPPTDDDVQRFYQICSSEPYRIHTRVRGEKGQDIEAACGQLALIKPGDGRSSSAGVDVEDLGTGARASASTGKRGVGVVVPKARSAKDSNSQAGRRPWVFWLGLPALALALSLRRR
jgi:hypothetical protein